MRNKLKVTELVTPKIKIGSGIGVIIGASMFLIGILMMMSLILFLPGIGFFLGGFFVMYYGLPKVETDCQGCDSTVKARMNEKTAKCEACGTMNPIKWVKHAKVEA